MINIYYSGYAYHAHRDFFLKQPCFPTYLFRLQTSGQATVMINDDTVIATPGTLILLKPGDYYELLIHEHTVSCDYYLACSGDWIDHWWQKSPKPQACAIELDDNLLQLWRQILVESHQDDFYRQDELRHHLLITLCLSLERAMQRGAKPSYHHHIVQMTRFIEEHATSDLTLDAVAKVAHLSPSRAAHLFKAQRGKTIIEYAIDVRLTCAIDQMKYTNMTLEQIAIHCGFGSYPHFYRLFKKRYARSPGDYRASLES